MGCLPGDFQEGKRPIKTFGETAHWGRKRPIKEGTGPNKANGQLSGTPPWWKTGPFEKAHVEVYKSSLTKRRAACAAAFKWDTYVLHHQLLSQNSPPINARETKAERKTMALMKAFMTLKDLVALQTQTQNRSGFSCAISQIAPLPLVVRKGPFRPKTSTAPESVVFCCRRNFYYPHRFPAAFFLSKKKQALLSTIRSVLLLP